MRRFSTVPFKGTKEQEAELVAWLEEHKATPGVAMPALQKELELIRQRGYATENGEYKTGMRSVAAPIFDETGSVRYAIGIIGMFRQIESERFSRATEVVLETARKISQSL